LKKVVCLLLAVVLVFMFVSCGKENNKTEEKFTPSLDKETTGVINIAGHYSNFEALEEEFNRFAEYYPNVELKYTCLDNYNKIISTTLQGENAPDIFFTVPWMMDSDDYQAMFDCAEDLSDPKLGINLSCIRDGLLAKDRNGKISLVPIYTTTYGMMVNENIFAKEGLSVPKTYNELIEVCNKLKDAGYSNPVMGYNQKSSMLYSFFFPHFCSTIAGNETAVKELNELKPSAGEYMRPTLELVADFMSKGIVDLESCNQIKDDYNAVIMRFFEGDVPMMFASGNAISGTEKREKQSEAFTASPFKYSFQPIPTTENGGFFLNNISIGFSVNKNSKNLDITNEFMRFLISTTELNLMAQSKRMVTPCKDMALDVTYSSFAALNKDQILYINNIGLADAPDVQMRKAGANVANGTMTVDEAIEAFGTLN